MCHLCTIGFIEYITLFLANFDPPPSVTLYHTSRDPQSTSHISDPPAFSRPSTKRPDKIPLYKIYLDCSWGFLSEGFVFCLEGFVRGGFCPFPLCQNTSVTT